MPSIRFAARPGRGLRTLAASSSPTSPACDATSWRDAARCRKVDPEVFFLPPKASPNRINAAKEVCEFCPVKAECLQWALDTDERTGVWGGTTPHERDVMLGRGKMKERKTQREIAADILAKGKQACARCGDVKSLGQFAVNSKALTGRAGTCKQCRADLARRTNALRRQGVDPVPRVEYPARLRRDAARANAA